MEIKLHANATTTPRIRRYLQQSDKSDRELARELSISITTVRRWRNREQTGDRLTTPHVVHKALRFEQIVLVNALREILQAPLDELLFMVVEGLGIPLSRATLNRYLKPAHQQRGVAELQGRKARKAGKIPNSLMLHYRLLALPMDDGGEHHLLWAREPISGWCDARIYSGISSQRVVGWLDDVLAHCPCDIQSIETEQVKWFCAEQHSTLAQWCERHNISTKTHAGAAEQNAIQVSIPLHDVIPAAKNIAPDELAQRLCSLYNTGKTQKKLGECTPQAFLEGL